MATRSGGTHQTDSQSKYALPHSKKENTETLTPPKKRKKGNTSLTPHLPGTLLLLDTLNPLAATHPTTLPTLLSTLLNPTTTLLALYHTDMPLPTASLDPYTPSPLTLLRHLATTLITTHSLPHVLARKAARDRSLAEPTHGLQSGTEGVLQGLGANGAEGLVLELEHRRKSGRGVREWYFLPHAGAAPKGAKEMVVLLEDHPAWKPAGDSGEVGGEEGPEAEAGTFELGLTERQRRAREGVVLPYFDAQKGGGEGGRILYDMGEEDDFDEEEDEI